MTIQQRANAFVQLGLVLQQLGSGKRNDEQFKSLNAFYFDAAQELFSIVKLQNGWFTESNVRLAIVSIAKMLEEAKIQTWIGSYDFPHENKSPKEVGLVLAGNIPLVGFHDFLAVLMSGNRVMIKLSSDDKTLLPFIVKILICIEPDFATVIKFTENRLNDCEAVIATGSGNTARYFEYYFGKIPHIIRKNRNSLAVLDGTESLADLQKLGEDIFTYYGLGCRNVSKLFIPKGYDMNKFFNAIFPFKEIINHNKYANNFDYNRAVYLMGKDKEGLLENGFLFLVKSEEYASPVAVIFYEYYEDIAALNKRFSDDASKIQCIVSSIPGINNRIPFGKAQQPELWDYADNVDTIKFLLDLKN